MLGTRWEGINNLRETVITYEIDTTENTKLQTSTSFFLYLYDADPGYDLMIHALIKKIFFPRKCPNLKNVSNSARRRLHDLNSL